MLAFLTGWSENIWVETFRWSAVGTERDYCCENGLMNTWRPVSLMKAAGNYRGEGRKVK